MNLGIIAVMIASLLLIAGVAVVVSQPVQAHAEETSDSVTACQYGNGGCPYKGEGGCTQGSNCGQETCAAKYGGSCGCGR